VSCVSWRNLRNLSTWASNWWVVRVILILIDPDGVASVSLCSKIIILRMLAFRVLSPTSRLHTAALVLIRLHTINTALSIIFISVFILGTTWWVCVARLLKTCQVWRLLFLFHFGIYFRERNWVFNIWVTTVWRLLLVNVYVHSQVSHSSVVWHIAWSSSPRNIIKSPSNWSIPMISSKSAIV